MRRREGNGPNEDDWLAEEDWVEAPTEEMSSPSGRGPRPRRQPPAGMPSRRLVGLVAAVSLVLLVILIAVLQGGDDSTEEPEAPTTPVTTAPGSDAAPTLQIPETGTLSEGDTGARVRRLQRALAQLGFDVSADGAFGPGTTAAVQSFQEDAGLTADGVAGPETARAINAALAEGG